MALSRATLIESLRSFAAAVGETPTRTRMNDEGPYSAQPYYRAFGSWNDALRAAGLAPNHENDVPDERLVRELRRLDGELDRVPRFEDVATRGAFSPSTYVRRWGSWPEAKAAAGLREATRTSRRIERETLVTELRRLAAELGGTPTQEEMNDHGEFSHRPYYRAFESWDDALDAAGLEPDRSNGTSDEALVRAMRELGEELGRTPTFDEMNDHGEFSVYPYLRRWGTWNDAVRAAGFGINKEWGGNVGVLEYGPNWRARRREALERDEWACVECDLSNDDHVDRYGQGLDVHHVEKLRSFESTEAANRLENLVTVCRECHSNLE